MSSDDAIPSASPDQSASSPHVEIIADELSDEEIDHSVRAIQLYERTVTHNPFIRKDLLLPHKKPSDKQQTFLLLSDVEEIFYGGAAGGGKSSALLMAALQFVHVPGYNALILRNSFPDLNQPGALIPVSKEWLTGLAEWNTRDRRWTFPSGATLTFGYLERYDDVYQYRSSEFQYIGFDELTLFDEKCYTYLFSRLRKTKDLDVPLRMRSASNPGGKGSAWVRERFVLEHTRHPGALFIPAKISDNPGLDRDDYEKKLSHLDAVTRSQLMDGNWEASEEGRFKLDWFKNGRYSHDTYRQSFQLHSGAQEVGNGIAVRHCTLFVTVDLAASVKTSSDYTVFLACAVTPWQQLLVLDMQRKKHPVEQIPTNLRDFCREIADRYRKQIAWAGVEANGMQIGIADACRQKEGMCPVRYLKPANQDKLARAQKAIIAAEQGRIFLPLNARWLDDFLYELIQFTGDPKKDSHDDAVDCLSYAVLSMSSAAFEAPSFSERSQRSDGGQAPQNSNQDGMSRIFRREGRMRRLFGGGS